jgi:hypothetical protein
MDAGMNDHITKPIDKKLLTRTLLQWIPATGVTPPTERADMGSVPILQVASTAPNAATPLIDLDAAAQRLGGNCRCSDPHAVVCRHAAVAGDHARGRKYAGLHVVRRDSPNLHAASGCALC